MNVYITSTPNYNKSEIEKIVNLLSRARGEIQFFAEDPFTTQQLAIQNNRLADLEAIESLTFEELFNLGNTFRIIKSISPEDFVVILSDIPNKLNWFSGFKVRNIFVDTQGWEYITKNDSLYGIAYQIIENIFQSLIELDISDVYGEPNIHHTSIGCINDMCQNKTEVLLKLRTGYICHSCLQRAIDKNVSRVALVQINDAIQIIRENFMNFDLLKHELKPKHVTVNEKGKIMFEDIDINKKFEALWKTLFIFFLSNIEGVVVDTLEEKKHKDRLWDIYHAVRKSGYKKTIDNLCIPQSAAIANNLKDRKFSTFPKTRSSTNSFLIQQLGKKLSEFYVINNVRIGNESIYKLNLTSEYVTNNI